MKAVEEAKKVLREHGYITEGLWHIEDVNQALYMTENDPHKYTEAEKRNYLEKVLSTYTSDIITSINNNLNTIEE